MRTLRSLVKRSKRPGDDQPATAALSQHDSSSASQSKKTFQIGLKLLHEPESAVVDIVFVHGLTGGREETWKAKSAFSPWPQALLPAKLPHARMLTFGYDANVANWRAMVSKNRIGDHAKNLLSALATHRGNDDTTNRPILFVAHSLGGLVCEDALLASRNSADEHLQNILTYTKGILFLGTPHGGSGFARWAELLAKSIGLIRQTNPQILEVLRGESEVLARIQTDFHTMARARAKDDSQSIAITCFYEELPLPGIGEVVPMNSAILPAYISIGIHSNHLDMTKFEAEDDPGLISVAGELQRWVKELRPQQGSLPKQKREAHFLVPFNKDPQFVGREDIIASINHRLKTEQRIALAGIGGVGKSQIAIEYCYRYKDAHPDNSIFWIHASSVERFDQAYKDIARRLVLPGWDDPKISKLELVSEWLNDTNHSWLMILDNADDEKVFFALRNETLSQGTDANQSAKPLSVYLPQTSKGSMIITSRNRNAAFRLTNTVENIIDVLPMSKEDADSLLRRKMPDDQSSDNDRTGLIEILEYLPLAITQAAAYINMRKPRMTISKYMIYFQENEPILLEDMGDLRRDHTVPNSVIITWRISFDQIKKHHPRAAELLSLMSVLDRQGIPEYLFSKNKSRLDFENALAPLNDFSLITSGREGESFEMHPLVQLAMRKWLDLHDEAKRYEEEAIGLLSESFQNGNYENWSICAALLPHAEVVLKYQCSHQSYSLQQANILHNTAWYFLAQGNYNSAQERSQQALETRRAFLTEENELFISSLGFHASVLERQGKYNEAEEMHRQELDLKVRVLGAEHLETLISMNNLAVVLSNQGKYDEAEKMDWQALNLKVKVLGAEHPETLTSMNNLATVLRNQGKYNEAEEMHRQTLDLRVKVLGGKHPGTLTSMNNLACVLRHQGKYDEAEKMHRQTLNIRVKLLGAEHPETLMSMNNLTVVLQNQSKYDEAEKMYQQALDLNVKVLGPEHPETLTSMNNLATVLRDQGKYNEAEEIHRQTLDLSVKVLGAEHPETLISMNNLAIVLRSQGRHNEAEEMHRQVLNLRVKVLGPEHPETLINMNNLAIVLRNQGRHNEAEEMHRQELDLCNKVLGAEHPQTLISMNNLAIVLRNQGRHNKAEEMYRRVLDLRVKVLGVEHPKTLASMNNLAQVLGNQSKYNEAEEMHQRALNLRVKVLGAEHPETLISMDNLAIVLRDQGRHNEAEEMHRQELDLRVKVLGAEHPETLISMSNLAVTLADQGKYIEAEKMQRQEVSLSEKVLGAEDPLTLASMNNLVWVLDRQGKHDKAEDIRQRKQSGAIQSDGQRHKITTQLVLS